MDNKSDKDQQLLDKIRRYEGTPDDLLAYVSSKAGSPEASRCLYVQKERSFQGNKEIKKDNG